ncbi:MAG: amidohydrolase [Balneolaceae bacterium]|nr:amidohydrolase [Balneolaceae bacterium]
MEELTKVRRELHQLAEVSGKEKKTAKKIKEFLATTNPDELITGVGGHGIAACYKGSKDGPSVMLRCELDALPIPEENDFKYKSSDKDTGHKCGHDGHMAIICGVAKHLKEQSALAGNVYLLFQPAEETGEGAQQVLEDEKFKELQPDYIFALHNLPGYEKNTVVVKEDVFAAASVGFIARFKGATSHAAHPEQGKSPALAMAQLVQSLSAIPQFDASLDDAAKVTVIHARLGERAFGTSPGYAEVMATLRTYDDELLEKMKEKASKISKGLAATYNLAIDTEWVEAFAATKNDVEMTSIIRQVAEDKGMSIKRKQTPFSWSEDFGHFTKQIPGAMFGLGSGVNQSSLHASDYDFPDEIIPAGVEMFVGIINKIQKNRK